MYQTNYRNRPYPINYQPSQYDNRIIGGGFTVPFLLGGLTGGLLSPAFYPRPYPPRPYPPRPFPMYPPGPPIYY